MYVLRLKTPLFVCIIDKYSKNIKESMQICTLIYGNTYTHVFA